MSAFCCFVPPRPEQGGEHRVVRALASRHGDAVVSWRDEVSGVVLATVRRAGEEGASASIATTATLAVVADAALYYREDLVAATRAAGIAVERDASPAALIAAAYEAWGAACFERIEGDFAAAVWDARTRTVHLSRDFTGGRPLFHAAARGGGVIATSTLDALLAVPGVDATVDRDALAESVAWIFAADARTAHVGVRRVPPGASIAIDGATGRERARCRWQPPVFERSMGALSLDDAAERLRELLGNAVRQRLSTTGPTAVWMSGGYDSTAVFAAGRDAGAYGLFPVSISYPVADIGREDEAIELVAERWRADVRWLRSTDVDLFARLGETAAAADEPFVHLYAEFNSTLARTSAAAGARVALGGFGGDQLFWASNVYLADLLQQGRLRTLRGEAKRLGLDASGLLEWIVRPLLPAPVRALLRRVDGGERWLSPLEKAVPSFVTASAAASAGLAGAFHRMHPRRAGESRSAYDTYFSLANPFHGRVLETVGAAAREHGVDYRSPLCDRRIVELAATRPRHERSSGGEQKVLLRRAMRSLLPASILARRPYKTGTARDLFAASARRWLPPMLADMSRAPLLGDLGVIDVDAFRRACDDFVARGDALAAGALIPALQTELWLRGADQRAADLAARLRTPTADARSPAAHATGHMSLELAGR